MALPCLSLMLDFDKGAFHTHRLSWSRCNATSMDLCQLGLLYSCIIKKITLMWSPYLTKMVGNSGVTATTTTSLSIV